MNTYKTMIIFLDGENTSRCVIDLSPERLGILKQCDKYFGKNNEVQEVYEKLHYYDISEEGSSKGNHYTPYQLAMSCLNRGKDKQPILDLVAYLMGVYGDSNDSYSKEWDFPYGYLKQKEFNVTDESILNLDEIIVTGCFNY